MKQKIVLMQLTVIGLISIFLFGSCNKKIEKRKISDYVYMNQSNHDILLHCYYLDKDSIYFLKKNGMISNTEDLISGSSYLIKNADSVKIIYDSTLIKVNSKFKSEGIFNLNNYVYKMIEDNHHEFIYYFNEKTFNEAK